MANTAQAQTSEAPAFINEIQENYRSRVSHAFIVHDNVHDYSDDTGARGELANALAKAFDTFCQQDEVKTAAQAGQTNLPKLNSKKPRVLAFYTFTGGLQVEGNNKYISSLQFAHDQGKKLFDKAMTDFYGKELMENDPLILKPRNLPQVLDTLNMYFQMSKAVMEANLQIKKTNPHAIEKPEMNFTVVFWNGDMLFPQKPLPEMNEAQQMGVGYLREWAKDAGIGPRNKIITVTAHLDDIADTLRVADSAIKAIRIQRPDVASRRQWLTSYDSMLKDRAAKGNPAVFNGKPVERIPLAEGFTLERFADIAAGMSRKQMEAPIFRAMMSGQAITKNSVRTYKEECINQESGGLIEFIQPTFGWEEIGGHEHLKRYMDENIVQPYDLGELDEVTRGLLLTGPPGTGKTMLALALAKELGGINCILAHMDRLQDGVVGGSEKKMRRFIDLVTASAPTVLVMDELDSMFSAGRSSPGDSGTSARLFNMTMTFLSDSARTGRVIPIGLTNRPDLIDAAFIRQGRFDARLPALPPPEGDAAGRMQIVEALTKKLSVEWGKDLGETLEDPTTGIGRLLHSDQIWTGAEIEAVIKKARTKARIHKHKRIMLADWNIAMDSIIPNTGDVQQQIDLALYFVNDREYVPTGWQHRIKSKDEMKTNLQTKYGISLDEEDRD